MQEDKTLLPNMVQGNVQGVQQTGKKQLVERQLRRPDQQQQQELRHTAGRRRRGKEHVARREAGGDYGKQE